MAKMYRVVGDTGSLARILVTLLDRDGTPITAGTVNVRAAGLFEGAMTHDGDGVWHYDPVAGDLSIAGSFRLEIAVDTIVLPSPATDVHELHVRARVEEPAA